MATSDREFESSLRAGQPRAVADLVMHLLIEVEALREALTRCPEAKRAYAEAYRATWLTAHNSAGVSSGMEKILSRWLGEGKGWPELAMMKRLGMTAEEIQRYQGEASTAETYT